MINSQKSFSLHDYLDVFLRRIWYFLIPLVIILAGTVTYAVMAPKWYRSSTLVLVSPAKDLAGLCQGHRDLQRGGPVGLHLPGNSQPHPPGAGGHGV